MKYGPWLLACLPPLALAGLYASFSLDFPRLDQWEFVLFLNKAYTGQLTFHDFWAQHNEHRLIFPRLLMLALAHLSHWDIRWELAVNLLLGLGIFMAYVACCPQRTWRLPLVSLLAFSMAQWRNWFLGWQMQIFLSLLATLVMMLLLSKEGRPWLRLVCAMLLATIATYSFANGMLAWGLGLLLLLIHPSTSKRTVPALVWCGVGMVVAASYLYGYHPPEQHADPGAFLHHPVTFVLYVLTYLGQPVAGFRVAEFASPFAIGAGVIGLTWWGMVVRRGPERNALCLALGLYSLMTALITANGRVEFGVEQAMSSRYVTLATPLWIAIIAGANPMDSKRLGKVGVILFTVLIVVTSLHGAYRWTERYNAMAPARDALLRGEDHPAYRFIYPPAPRTVLERREILVRHGLSIFAATE